MKLPNPPSNAITSITLYHPKSNLLHYTSTFNELELDLPSKSPENQVVHIETERCNDDVIGGGARWCRCWCSMAGGLHDWQRWRRDEGVADKDRRLGEKEKWRKRALPDREER
ncbi:unnamed protein product [Ilex paraguariensis]|uniref:Uncharacterized protein n=1 Tax=Ilex paraguariensis TaxID=185542 RepID=A0ABC8T843_9AQUA